MPRQRKKSWPLIRRPTALGRPSTSSPRPAPACAGPPPQAAPPAATPCPPPQRAGLHRRAHGPRRIRPWTEEGGESREEGGERRAPGEGGGTRTREEARRLPQGRRRALRPPCGSSTAAAPPLLLHLLHCRSAPPLRSRPQQGRAAPALERRCRARSRPQQGEGRGRSACSPAAALLARPRRRGARPPGARHEGAQLRGPPLAAAPRAPRAARRHTMASAAARAPAWIRPPRPWTENGGGERRPAGSRTSRAEVCRFTTFGPPPSSACATAPLLPIIRLRRRPSAPHKGRGLQ